MEQHFPRTWGEQGRKVRKTQPFWVTTPFHSHVPSKMLIVLASISPNTEENMLIFPFGLFPPCSICHCRNPFLSIKTPRRNSGLCLSTKHDIWIPSKAQIKAPAVSLNKQPGARWSCWHQAAALPEILQDNCALFVPIAAFRAEAWLPNDRELLPACPLQKRGKSFSSAKLCK